MSRQRPPFVRAHGAAGSRIASLRGGLVVLAVFAAGCRWGVSSLADTGFSCDARTLDPGEVRARRIPCSDELPEDGEGRRYDWLVENAHVRFVVRHRDHPLTVLDGGGGTVVDALEWSGSDPLAEAIPVVGGQALEVTSIRARQGEETAELVVTGEPVEVSWLAGLGEFLPVDTGRAGSQVELIYRLGVADRALGIEGADALWVLPREGAERLGSVLYVEGTALAVAATENLDLGGAVVYRDPTALAAGDPSAVHKALGDGAEYVSGTSTGEWIEGLQAGERCARLPVEYEAGATQGEFGGYLPPGTEQVRAVADGYEPGEGVSAGEDLALEPGDEGTLTLRFSSAHGHDGHALLEAVDADGQVTLYPVAPGTSRLPLGPGTWDLRVTAGPRWERWEAEAVEVRGHRELAVSLRDAMDTTGWILADLDLRAWPSRDDRTSSEDVLAWARAQGVGFAVVTARDEIAEADPAPHWDQDLRTRAGSRAVTEEQGEVGSWPWSSNSRKAAHGATHWIGASAVEVARRARGGEGKDRFLVVDGDWLDGAGEPWTWDPVPDAVQLSGIEDLASWIAVLDAWGDLGVVGPWTWLPTEDPGRFSAAEPEAGLVEACTVATSGPLLEMEVEGVLPGGSVSPGGPLAVWLRVQAPTWIPLDRAVLVVDGEERYTWDLSGESEAERLEAWRHVEPQRYVFAAVWGEEDPGTGARGPGWAVTGPVWVGEP